MFIPKRKNEKLPKLGASPTQASRAPTGVTAEAHLSPPRSAVHDTALHHSDPEEFTSSNARRRKQHLRAYFSKSSPDVSLYIIALGRGSPRRFSTPQDVTHSPDQINAFTSPDAESPEKRRVTFPQTSNATSEQQEPRRRHATRHYSLEEVGPAGGTYAQMSSINIKEPPTEELDIDDERLPPDSPVPPARHRSTSSTHCKIESQGSSMISFT